ncbi:histidine phosphatase family protein [Dictyobacter aurantiacus]|uniref:Phosphoglycerate mutase n=1 Tax=Dictyobacter aurantiacus TaxID=1936993 RepID=A0A401ZT74_9CHLR|nr:histidine phosphatase family protein [Dictyobacter aurantiacus]GCE09996.1 hypothetical protein KDAU_73250 [Dictyobacter aurantiacus]
MLILFYSFHTSSVDNEAGRASGHADVPLSALGRQQARELGQRYAAQPFDAVFSSDLQRAVLTAELAFADRLLPLVRDARLRECDYGNLTQAPFVQVERERRQHLMEPFPQGESVFMVVQRVGDFLRDILRDYDGKTIAVIGHGATRYGLEYWCHTASLEEIVFAPHEWRTSNIWRYEVQEENFTRRSFVP